MSFPQNNRKRPIPLEFESEPLQVIGNENTSGSGQFDSNNALVPQIGGTWPHSNVLPMPIPSHHLESNGALGSGYSDTLERFDSAQFGLPPTTPKYDGNVGNRFVENGLPSLSWSYSYPNGSQDTYQARTGQMYSSMWASELPAYPAESHYMPLPFNEHPINSFQQSIALDEGCNQPFQRSQKVISTQSYTNAEICDGLVPWDTPLTPPIIKDEMIFEGAFDFDAKLFETFDASLAANIEAEKADSPEDEALHHDDADSPDAEEGIIDPEICFGLITTAFCSLFSTIGSEDIGDSTKLECRLRQKGVTLVDSQGKELGVVDCLHGDTLKGLKMAIPSVRYEAFIPQEQEKETKGKQIKRKNTVVKIHVLVFGMFQDLEKVGLNLSDAGVYLQEPDPEDLSVDYRNPHVFTQESDLTPFFRIQNENHQSLEDTALKVIHAASNDTLGDVEVDSRVVTELQSHQRSAVWFMMLRESENIMDKRYTLWEKEISRDQFRHKVTRSKSESKPIECRGGLLADDMGMGKSLSTLTLIVQTLDDACKFASIADETRPRSRATLIITPLTTIHNWCDEIVRHIHPGKIKAFPYVGQSKARLEDLLDHYDVVVTTYGKVTNSKLLQRINWFRIVLDEAHNIRNPATKMFKSIIALEAERRWCLSGTPLHNSLNDLFSLTRFLRFQPFDSTSQARKHITAHLQKGHQKGLDNLGLMMSTFCLRRIRDPSLIPPFSTCLVDVLLSVSERQRYETIKTRALMEQAESMKTLSYRNNLLRDILPLRQICCHGIVKNEEEESGAPDIPITSDLALADLVSPQDLGPKASLSPLPNIKREDASPLSSKLLKVIENLDNLAAMRQKSLLFSSWKTTLDELQDGLSSRGIQYLRIDGETKFEQRREAMQTFTNSQSVTVLLMTLGTGAVGLNLIAATHVHLVEPHWNPMIEEQAAARVHRIGQKNNVTIYRYIVKDSIEEKIGLFQQSKLRLVELSGLNEKTTNHFDTKALLS